MSRALLLPLNPVYRAAVATKNSVYARGWLQSKRLRWPVISIGNLSVGGSGKTPLTILLAHLLRSCGLAVDVLSRGYGRSSRAIEQVDPAGSADRFGDEPLLIAARTGVPVFVGASRCAAGLLAETKAAPYLPGVHLLDDGFQHRQLARNVDIVVVHRSDFVDRLLPAGNLREPLAALRRASFVVLREEDSALESQLRQLGIDAPIWWMRRSLRLPGDLSPTTKRVVAFCAIARAGDFFSALENVEVQLERTVAFADHHRYSRDDVQRLVRVAARLRAGAFVITEKDAVKLTPPLLQLLESAAPVRIAKLEVSLRDEASVLQQLLEKLPRG